MYKIEEGITIPKKCRGLVKYPLERMKVGDSFLIKGAGLNVYKSKYASARSLAARLNMAVVGRLVPDGLRIWRVK